MTEPRWIIPIGYRALCLSVVLLCQLMIGPRVSAVQSPGGEPLSKLPGVSHSRIRLIDGVSYCHAGYGTQRIFFEIDGQPAVAADTAAAPVPSFQPLNTTFLKFGCVLDRVFMEYSMIRDTMLLREPIRHDGVVYDGIHFQLNTAAAGYVFSLWPHRLYIDLGIGYTQVDYSLRSIRLSSGSSAVIGDNHFLLLAATRFIFNSFAFAQWQHLKALENGVLSYANQLGIHFLVRF
jgi:hypothetical protein